jgi:hypothetical protein
MADPSFTFPHSLHAIRMQPAIQKERSAQKNRRTHLRRLDDPLSALNYFCTVPDNESSK